jgi:hypothetical protein
MKSQGVSFRHAVELLRADHPSLAAELVAAIDLPLEINGDEKPGEKSGRNLEKSGHPRKSGKSGRGRNLDIHQNLVARKLGMEKSGENLDIHQNLDRNQEIWTPTI